jgi:hypothetical protein
MNKINSSPNMKQSAVNPATAHTLDRYSVTIQKFR